MTREEAEKLAHKYANRAFAAQGFVTAENQFITNLADLLQRVAGDLR